MSLSTSNSYKVLGTYADPSMNVFMLNLSIEHYVDSHVSNKDLALILKGYGKNVDTSGFPTSFVRLFADELKSYREQFNKSRHLIKDNEYIVFQASIRNYLHFIKANFSDSLFFEAVVICLIKYANCVPLISHCHDEVDLISDSLSKHKHLYLTTYKEYAGLQ